MTLTLSISVSRLDGSHIIEPKLFTMPGCVFWKLNGALRACGLPNSSVQRSRFREPVGLMEQFQSKWVGFVCQAYQSTVNLP